MRNILIVEDDLSIAMLLEEALEDDGYYVTGIARTLAEAVASAEQHDPDCAIIDLHLAGGSSGIEVADYLRSVTKLGILFSTGNEDRNLKKFAGDAVMSKPYALHDVGRGIKIVDELASFGRTELAYPASFRIIES
jgi:CheY-like chemotaxis protein